MKRMLGAIALAVTITPAFAADVGVSVTIGQPGFYGTIEIGDYPRPRVIYAEPKIIMRAPVTEVVQPVYLRVPPGHARNWRKHCGAYNACSRPVYFVQDSWYNNVYVPQYRERSGRGGDDGQGRNHNGNDGGKGNKGNKGKGHN